MPRPGPVYATLAKLRPAVYDAAHGLPGWLRRSMMAGWTSDFGTGSIW
jgi:hypothetical protein